MKTRTAFFLCLSVLLSFWCSTVYASGEKFMFHFTPNEISPDYLKNVIGILSNNRTKFTVYRDQNGKMIKEKVLSDSQIKALSSFGYGGDPFGKEHSYYPIYEHQNDFYLIGMAPDSSEKIWIRKEHGDTIKNFFEAPLNDIRIFMLSGEKRTRRFYTNPDESSSFIEISQPKYKLQMHLLEYPSEKLDTVRFTVDDIVNGFAHVTAKRLAYGLGYLKNYEKMTGWIKLYDTDNRLTAWIVDM